MSTYRDLTVWQKADELAFEDFSRRLGYLSIDDFNRINKLRDYVGKLLWNFYKKFRLSLVQACRLSGLPACRLSGLMACWLVVLALLGCGGGSSGDGGGPSGSGNGSTQNTATLSWDPNTEPDLAGYKVYHRIASSMYGDPVAVVTDVTDNTFTITGLELGAQHCFVVTAYDFSENESSPSNEACKDIL